MLCTSVILSFPSLTVFHYMNIHNCPVTCWTSQLFLVLIILIKAASIKFIVQFLWTFIRTFTFRFGWSMKPITLTWVVDQRTRFYIGILTNWNNHTWKLFLSQVNFNFLLVGLQFHLADICDYWKLVSLDPHSNLSTSLSRVKQLWHWCQKCLGLGQVKMHMKKDKFIDSPYIITKT